MPAHQCRLDAERCLRLAKRARKPEMRQNLTALAGTWTKLAADLEFDEALISSLLELDFSEPIDALPLALKLRSWPTPSNRRRRIVASRRAYETKVRPPLAESSSQKTGSQCLALDWSDTGGSTA
jgi:hypothetical protein